MQTVNKSFTLKDLQSYNEKNLFKFKGYASTFGNTDYDGDVIMPGAFDRTLDLFNKGEWKVRILWQHDHKMPIGVPEVMKADAKGLYIEGALPLDDEFVAKRVVPQMRIGSIDEMSIGFRVVDSAPGPEGTREIKDTELFEFSLVTVACNNRAKVTEVKSVVPVQKYPFAPQDMAWDSSAAVKRVRDFVGAAEAPNAKYKTAFLWYESENEDNFGAYKLPIVDVVDGALKVVPRAIFAAAAAISGARGGVMLPAADRQKVIANINKYYDKLEMESPLKGEKSIVVLDDLSSVSIEDLKNYLTNGNAFSMKAADFILNALQKQKEEEDTKRIKNNADFKKCFEIIEKIKKSI